MAVVALVALPSLLGGSPGDGLGLGPGASSVGSTSPSTEPSPSVTVTASEPPSASPVPSPASSTSPSADPLADARAAIRDARVAIAVAKGGRDGLKGKEAKALDDRVNAVERALDQGNLRDAAKRADDLVRRVEELVRRRTVTGQQADRLLAAAQALRDAIPAA